MKYYVLLLSVFLFVSCNKTQNTAEKNDVNVKNETSVTEVKKTDEVAKNEVKETAKEGKKLEYKWDTPSCSMSGNYDSSKYTEEELKNTFDLCYTFDGSVSISTDVVFVTGDTVSVETRSFFEDNKNLFLAKPFKIEEVKEVIQQMFETHPGR